MAAQRMVKQMLFRYQGHIGTYLIKQLPKTWNFGFSVLFTFQSPEVTAQHTPVNINTEKQIQFLRRKS